MPIPQQRDRMIRPTDRMVRTREPKVDIDAAVDLAMGAEHRAKKTRKQKVCEANTGRRR